MFDGSTNFNQPLTNLLNGLTVNSRIVSMFENATNFNQNLNNWNMSKITSITNMFLTDNITPTTVLKFNNGELGYTSISGTPSSAVYTNSTKTLTCNGALFTTDLTNSDVLIIITSTVIFSSAIQSITNDTTIILVTAFGSNFIEGTIVSITKQVAGTSPLLWDTSKITSFQNAFKNCIYFNQNISSWNVYLNDNVSYLFNSSSTNVIHLFNNGETIIGTTSPLNWIFITTPSSTNWRNNCRLTNENAVTTPPLT